MNLPLKVSSDPRVCECSDWTHVGHSKFDYHPDDEKTGEPTGHHPDCCWYEPPSVPPKRIGELRFGRWRAVDGGYRWVTRGEREVWIEQGDSIVDTDLVVKNGDGTSPLAISFEVLRQLLAVRGYGLTIVRSEEPPALALPPGPLCDVCGHEMCPCCGDWCDQLVGSGLSTCCDGHCTVEPEDIALWQLQCKPLMRATSALVSTIPGPWLSLRVRQERGIPL